MYRRTSILMFLALSVFSLAYAQDSSRRTLEMSELTPGLLTVALNTQYFSDLAGELELTEDQVTKLQDLLYQSLLEESRFTADQQIAIAQIERLLADPDIDLKVLKQRLQERYDLAAQADFFHIQKSIEAVKLLTHEQHLKAFPVYRKWLEEKKQPKKQTSNQKSEEAQGDKQWTYMTKSN